MLDEDEDVFSSVGWNRATQPLFLKIVYRKGLKPWDLYNIFMDTYVVYTLKG